MTGVRRDGTPYEVIADSGVQNPRDPNRTDLDNSNAQLHMSDNGDTRILGDTGALRFQRANARPRRPCPHQGRRITICHAQRVDEFQDQRLGSKAPVRLDFDRGWVAGGFADHDATMATRSPSTATCVRISVQQPDDGRGRPDPERQLTMLPATHCVSSCGRKSSPAPLRPVSPLPALAAAAKRAATPASAPPRRAGQERRCCRAPPATNRSTSPPTSSTISTRSRRRSIPAMSSPSRATRGSTPPS